MNVLHNIRKFYTLLFLAVSLFFSAQSNSFISQVNKLPIALRKEFITNQIKELYKKDSIKALQEVGDALIFFNGKNIEYAILLGEQAQIYDKLKSYDKALESALKSLNTYELLKDFDGEMAMLTKLSRIYRSLNKVNEALDLLFKKLKTVEGNAKRECLLYERIGILFKEIKNEDKALYYLQQAEEKSNQISIHTEKFNTVLLSIYKNIGVLYRNNNNIDKAMFYFDKGYALAEATDNVNFKGVILNSLGILYKEKKQYQKAIATFEESIKYKLKSNNNEGVSNSYANIGDLYIEINNYKKAEEYLLKSYSIATKTREKKAILDACNNLFKLYDKTNKPTVAYPYLKRAFTLKDSMYKLNMADESAKLEAIYNSEKKQKEIEINKIKNQQLEKNIESKNRERNLFIIGSLILIVFLIWSVWSFIGKKRANAQLEEKNGLINNQKLVVEQKQKEVIDSIHYAKRIQTALLTSEKYIQKSLTKLQKK